VLQIVLKMRLKFLILGIFSYFIKTDTKMVTRLTGVVCEISRKTIPEQPTCFIKTYNTQTFLTIRFNITRNTPRLKLNYSDNFKNSDGYNKVFELNNLEICKMVQSSKSSSLLPFKLVFEYFMENLNGNVLEICSKQEGEKFIENFNAKELGPLYASWPTGDYLTSHHFYDKNDQNVINVTVYTRLYQK
jgi:hypothetical protein